MPNAASVISGVKFEKKDGKMVSVDDVPEPLAVIFLSISGYEACLEENSTDGTGNDATGNADQNQEASDAGGQEIVAVENARKGHDEANTADTNASVSDAGRGRKRERG